MIDETKMEHNLLTSSSPLCGLRTGRLVVDRILDFRRGRIVEDCHSQQQIEPVSAEVPSLRRTRERSDEMVPAERVSLVCARASFELERPHPTILQAHKNFLALLVLLEAETSDMFPAGSLWSRSIEPHAGGYSDA